MEIIDYKPELAQHFDKINRDWIEKYFMIEDIDNKVLQNPEEQIISPGDAILFASEGDEILGTVALMMHSEEVIELTKMGVYESERNNGIGKLLLNAAQVKAKTMGFKTLILYSNRKLKNALHLYKKYGFKEIEIQDDHYNRCNIQMEMEL